MKLVAHPSSLNNIDPQIKGSGNLMVLVVHPFVTTLYLQMSVVYLLITHNFHIVLTILIIAIIIIIIITKMSHDLVEIRFYNNN